MTRVWTVVAVCCSVVCGLAGSASSQEPAQFESLLASAQQAQTRGDFETAAESYRQASALHPEIAEFKANLGLMYYQVGKDEQAIDAFRQADRLKPNLFVPNLFLGLEYVKRKRFIEAIPHLKKAAVSKPSDIQAQLGLGQAYAATGSTRWAVAAYQRAVRLEPQNADAWYRLGVSYLEEVEADARILLSQHRSSVYLQVLLGDTFSEQRALIQASDAYKKALTFKTFPPGVHAAYGLVLLNQHELAGAERELNAELASNPGFLLAKLGLARLHLEKGMTELAVKEIEDICKMDADFLRANAVVFTRGLPQPKRAELQQLLQQSERGTVPSDVAELLAGISENGSPASQGRAEGDGISSAKPLSENAAKYYSSGRYGECTRALVPRIQALPAKDLQLLAQCGFLSGNYGAAYDAGVKLAASPATEAAGLYWGTKSSERLATEALARASTLDTNSHKFHVLLGDLYRQRQHFPDAENEYRKALALQARDTGALFGLSLALLADNQLDEAYRLAQSALETSPDDAELNAVMGEILCAKDDFSGAEPYLKKSLNTKPEYVSHVHALLGKVYAHMNRPQEAIAELKLGLRGDKDGALHYQIARLYLKAGDKEAAKVALEESQRLRKQGLTRAAVAMQQGEDLELR